MEHVPVANTHSNWVDGEGNGEEEPRDGWIINHHIVVAVSCWDDEVATVVVVVGVCVDVILMLFHDCFELSSFVIFPVVCSVC